MTTAAQHRPEGFEGGAAPSQAGPEDKSQRDLSDGSTACQSPIPLSDPLRSSGSEARGYRGRGEATGGVPDRSRSRSDSRSTAVPGEGMEPSVAAPRSGKGIARRAAGGRLDVRYDGDTLGSLRARAERLGLAPGTWVRSVVRDALHGSRSEELDAAIAAALYDVEARTKASADARELAAQIRPLAINVNDLDRRARAGDPVTLSEGVPELIELLREVRALLGDRGAS